MQTCPKQFLFVAVLGGPSAGGAPRLTKHLNDHFYISHWHDSQDGFEHLDELREGYLYGDDDEGDAEGAHGAHARRVGRDIGEEEDDDDDDESVEEVQAPPKKTSRAAVLSQSSAVTKKAPARGKAAASQSTAKSKQTTLSFAPSGTGRSTRTAATNARKRTQKVVSL